jgi:uncharacterized protein YecE (DUF72 family)
MRLHIGTSGYSYAAWKGTFYPAKLPGNAMLGHYAAQFDTVEINSSFYRMPAASVLATWAAQVPADFQFAFKVPRRITHDRRLRGVTQEFSHFLATTAALETRRGPLLVQLPPSLAIDRARLEEFLALIPAGQPMAFEFRHVSWHDAAVYEALQARNFALVVADTDEAGASPIVATADWGYLRLRRADYDDNALNQWATRIGTLNWCAAYVYFKHEDEARGPVFAQRLRALATTLSSRSQ